MVKGRVGTVLGAKAEPSGNWARLQAKLKEEAAERAVKRGQTASSKPPHFRHRRKKLQKGPGKKETPATGASEDGGGRKEDSEERQRGPLGLDCEYVGVGRDGTEDLLARVSVVDASGGLVLDAYVRPTERITDFRTQFSGIRPSLLTQASARTFEDVQAEVAQLIKGRLVVGHALHNDFKVLKLSHPGGLTRDTARYGEFQRLAGGLRHPSLKAVAKAVLGIGVQRGEHNSIRDAQVAMQLYQLHRKPWETWLKSKKIKTKKKVTSIASTTKAPQKKKRKPRPAA